MNTELQPDNHFNIAACLKEMAADRPFKRAVAYPFARDRNGRFAYTHLTFQELDEESDRLAHGLEAAGIRRGVRTILMVKPGLEFFALTFALFKTGAVPVVVDPGMGIGRMLRCLQESRPEAFIGIPKAHVLRKIRPAYFQGVKTWITVGRKWFWGGYTLSQVRQSPWKPYAVAKTLRHETAAILFTTGSTGPAKGAVYTHGNFGAQIRHIQAHFQIGEDEIDLPTFPLFALFDPALGMTAVIPDMDPTRPAEANPEKIVQAIQNQGVTNMFASPALLNRVGRYGQELKLHLPSLKRVVSAGAPVSAEAVEGFTAMLQGASQVHTPYGATEAVPVASIASDEILGETRMLSEKGFGTCVGRPLEGIELKIIRIVDDPIIEWTDQLEVADGEIGEIAVQGDLVTRQYFKRPRDDALAKIMDGAAFWHRMGDLGWRDKMGRIWFCGRKSHRVITGADTLFTIPCEAVFNRHAQVFRSALVGVGHPPEQIPVICIELEAGARRQDRKSLREELLDEARRHPHTRPIQELLFHKKFPVDIRHNSKIFREKLAEWAARKLS